MRPITAALLGLAASVGSTYGFGGITIPRASDAPKRPRPDGADERDLAAAQEKRERRAEKARRDEERRVVGQNVAMEGMAKR